MRLGDLHPRTRVDLDARRSSTPSDARSTRRSSATRTAPPRRPSPRCASAASAWSTCPPTSGYATWRPTTQWYGEHGGARAVRHGRLRAARAVPRRSCGTRRPRRQSRLLPDRRAARPRAARARRPGRRRGDHRRQVRRLRRRPRRPRTTTHFVSANENLKPVQGRAATATRRRSSRSSRRSGADRRIVFVPHLAPLAQGELDSCYVSAARETTADGARSSCSPRPTRTSRSSTVLGPPAGRARGARHQRLPHVRPLRRATRAGSWCSARIDNLWKGAASQAVQNLNLMFGRPETEGLRVTLLRLALGRTGPPHVTELDGRPAAGLPRRRRRRRPQAARRAATSACSSATRPTRRRAARFTASGVLAAPVVVTQDRTRLDALRVVAANSGNANAATGGRGLDAAAKMQGAAAMCAGVREDQVAVASTGVIGVQLDGRQGHQGPARPPRRARRRRRRRVRRGDPHDRRVPQAGDARRSRCRRARCGCRAQAKGAGMISPRFATMLCFVADGRRAAARDRGPAARRVRQALLRPHLRRRPAVDQRHRRS